VRPLRIGALEEMADEQDNHQHAQPKIAVPAGALKAFGSFASLMSFRVRQPALAAFQAAQLRASGRIR